PGGLEALDLGGLPGRVHTRKDPVDSDLGRDPDSRTGRVAGEEHGLEAECLEAAHGLGARRLHRVAYLERRAANTVPGDLDSVPPRPPDRAGPSTTPLTPPPAVLRKPVTSGRAPTSSLAARTTARATGCSDAASTAPASRRTSARPAPFSKVTPASSRRPSVTV